MARNKARHGAKSAPLDLALLYGSTQRAALGCARSLGWRHVGPFQFRQGNEHTECFFHPDQVDEFHRRRRLYIGPIDDDDPRIDALIQLIENYDLVPWDLATDCPLPGFEREP